MNSRFPQGSHHERLHACLDTDFLPPTIRLIKREADACERDGKVPGAVGGLLVRLGDYARARRIYARWYQTDPKAAAEPLADLAFLTGDFQEAERFYLARLSRITVSPTRGQRTRREVQVKLLLTLAEQGKTDEAKKLLSQMDLTIAPNQPASSLEAIRYSFYPRLRAAMAVNDAKNIEAEAERLLGAIRERSKLCSCADVEPEVLLELAQALKRAGKAESMKEVCNLVIQGPGPLDIALPQNQAALGRAHALLGDRAAALKHLGDAALLAPDDCWVKKGLAALKSAN